MRLIMSRSCLAAPDYRGAGAQKVGHMTDGQGFQVVGRADWPMAIGRRNAGAPPPLPSTFSPCNHFTVSDENGAPLIGTPLVLLQEERRDRRQGIGIESARRRANARAGLLDRERAGDTSSVHVQYVDSRAGTQVRYSLPRPPPAGHSAGDDEARPALLAKPRKGCEAEDAARFDLSFCPLSSVPCQLAHRATPCVGFPGHCFLGGASSGGNCLSSLGRLPQVQVRRCSPLHDGGQAREHGGRGRGWVGLPLSARPSGSPEPGGYIPPF